MTGANDRTGVVSMGDIHARLSRVMALIRQLSDEAQEDSGRIAAERSGDNAGGSVE